MQEPAPREKVRFVSGDTQCAAWHYPGTNGACVIMAGGFAVAKEPATDLFASRFHQAGFTVLAFDYRRIGESGGQPRQVLPIADQLADWHAAIAFASTLPGVDPRRVGAWGFSMTGGHLLHVAAANPRLTAVIAQTPQVGGPAATRNAAAYQRPTAMLRFTLRGILDAMGALVGRPPLLVPLVGQPGTVAMLTTPDAQDSDRALNPDNAYPDWPPAAAARSALCAALYRPGSVTSRIRCPLLVMVCDQDQVTLAAPTVRAARRAPNAELVRLPGGHYAPFLDEHEQAVQAELSFLRRHLIEPSHVGRGEQPADSARN
jgi:pimeloyl-ACP methyl ester carboxylesterase